MLCRSEQITLKSICKSLANKLISKPVKYNIQPIYFCVHLFKKHSFKEWKLGLLVQYQVLSMLPYTLLAEWKKENTYSFRIISLATTLIIIATQKNPPLENQC